MRRHVLVQPALVLTAAFGIAGAIWLLPRTSIDPSHYQRIHVGMTRSDAETLLGGHARSEMTGPVEARHSPADSDDARLCHENWLDRTLPRSRTEPWPDDLWASDRAVILLVFDEEDRVIGKSMQEVRRVGSNGFLDRLASWAGL